MKASVIHRLRWTLHLMLLHRPTMPARSAQAFLTVAEEEGQSVTEYARRLEIPVTTASRLLIDMSDRDRNLNQGAGLVEGRDNPDNRREKQYWLTPKGKAVLASIVKEPKS